MEPAEFDLDLIRPLMVTPPPEFVAARNALVKELKAAKRKDAAATVGRLRRPDWTDWSLNAAADHDPSLAGAYAEAADVLREAQAASIEGREGPDLRGAMKSLRDASAALARAASSQLRQAGRAPDDAGALARLGDVAGQPSAVAHLSRAVLGAVAPEDEDLFAGLTPAARPRKEPPPRRAARPALAVVPDATDEPEPPPRARRKAATPEPAEAAEEPPVAKVSAAERAARRRAQRDAVSARDRAARRVERAEHATALAQAELDEARAELDSAGAALAALRSEDD